MRCLRCQQDDLPPETKSCPSCNVYLPTLIRDLLPAGKKLDGGTYQIEYPLGRGGFGVTYRGIHVQLERPVAIKEFYPVSQVVRQDLWVTASHSKVEEFQRGKERFIEEGKILAKVNHSNVVRVMDYFEDNGTAYLVMELVQGPSLRRVLKENNGKLETARIERIMTQIVEALAALHAKNICHLDLKPENVMLTGEHVTLVDFGCAKMIGEQTKSVYGISFDYAAPELFGQDSKGPETDIYELGVMLYEMLSGKLPLISLERLTHETHPWESEITVEPWSRILEAALRLTQEDRPKNVRAWWASRNRPVNFSRPAASSPDRIVVHPINGDCKTIREAVHLLKEGDTLLINPGQYQETVVLDGLKNIYLKGSGENIQILNSYHQPSLLISNCQGIFIEGLNFQLISDDAPHSVIEIYNSQGVNISSCTATGSTRQAGIEVAERSKVTIRDIRAEQNRIGLYIHSHASGEISNSHCEKNDQYGIWAQGANTSVKLIANHCHSNGDVGILYSDEAEGWLENNRCNQNGSYGIVIANRKKQPEVAKNNFYSKNSRGGIAWDKNWIG